MTIKKHMITLFAMLLAASASGQHLAVSGEKASTSAAFLWSETSYDFGKTKRGIPVSFEFRFTNTGMAPLVISSVKASCGCTVTAYTKDPVVKGASGFVRATYNAATIGRYSKTVTVHANTPEGTLQLTVKGEVVE